MTLQNYVHDYARLNLVVCGIVGVATSLWAVCWWGYAYFTIRFSNTDSLEFRVGHTAFQTLEGPAEHFDDLGQLLACGIGSKNGGCALKDSDVDEVLAEVTDRSALASKGQLKVTKSRIVLEAPDCQGLLNTEVISLFFNTTTAVHFRRCAACAGTECCCSGELRFLDHDLRLRADRTDFEEFAKAMHSMNASISAAVSIEDLSAAAGKVEPETCMERLASAVVSLRGVGRSRVAAHGSYLPVRTDDSSEESSSD